MAFVPRVLPKIWEGITGGGTMCFSLDYMVGDIVWRSYPESYPRSEKKVSRGVGKCFFFS